MGGGPGFRSPGTPGPAPLCGPHSHGLSVGCAAASCKGHGTEPRKYFCHSLTGRSYGYSAHRREAIEADQVGHERLRDSPILGRETEKAPAAALERVLPAMVM